MKKLFMSLVVFCATMMSVSAQGELETYSRYDVNHKNGVNVADVTEVVERAKKVNGDESQVVDAEALNAVLKDIYAAISELKTLKSSVEAVRNEVSKLLQNALPDDYHEYVDLGFGPKWATMNVGAENAYEAGLYVQWGATEEPYKYNWDDYFDFTPSAYGKMCKIYNDEGHTTLMPVHDLATKAWGGSWRIPTQAEWQALIDNCTWTWDPVYQGYEIVSKINGKSIYLKATGYKDTRGDSGNGEVHYWSSTYAMPQWNYDNSQAFSLFGDGDQELNVEKHSFRNYGMNIRPVCD